MDYLNSHTRQATFRWCMFLTFLLLSIVPLLAQQREITGLVCDPNGEPLIGVNVIAKGGNGVGTISDMDGKFRLKVENDATLVFSYIGYTSLEKKITKNDSFLRITLKEDSELLEEVVVVGYGTKRKGGVSAAVSSINSEEIVRSTSTNTSGAIVGKLAGITARQKSGVPGTGTNIQIRNLGTPLYVIDGIMTDEGSFNNLDVNDIGNISILKDGAAAIFGVKAANGVVLVTTKTGKKNSAPQVNVNTYLAWQQWTTYPELMDAYEYNYAQAMQKVNRGVLTDPAEKERTKAELAKWKQGGYNRETGEDYRSFDWYDNYIGKAAPQQYVSANISGGGEKTTYYLSMSYVNQDAVIKDVNFNRFNMQANFDIQVTKYFKVGYQMSGKIEQYGGPSLIGVDEGAGDYSLIRTSLFGLLPTYRPFANDNPNYLNYLVAHDSRNIAAMDIEHAGEVKKQWRTIRNNLNIEYITPLKGLTAKALFSYFFANKNENRNEKGWKEYTYNKENDEYILMYDKEAAGATKRDRIRENLYDITGQFLLNYDNTFGKHNITGTAGFEFYQRQRNYLFVGQKPVDNPFVDLAGTSENNIVKEEKGIYSTASFVFRAGYNYDQKYILDFAGRYDGSWKFPKNNRWGFFPSVSGAWRVSEENFFKESKLSSWISNIKLRVSYGEMGDDNLGGLYPDFAYQSGYLYNQGSSFIPSDPFQSTGDNNNVIGSAVKGVPVVGLSWMKTSIFDIGLDLGFLDNRLNIELDVFKRSRSGIAARPDDINFPLESGLSALPRNLNTDMNLGIDGFIKWSDAIKSFKYNIGVNATLARRKSGKVYGEKFFNGMDKYWWGTNERWANMVNGNVWMMESVGVFQTQEEIDNYPVNIDGKNNVTLLPGDLIFKDVNDDGVINNYDRRPLGYAGGDWPWEPTGGQGNKNPLMSLGFTLGFDWKGIDFNADFAGGFMNTFIPDWFMIWGSGTHHIANGYKYNTLDVWHHEDIFDPTSPWVPGKFPAFRGMDNPSAYYTNSFYNKNVKYLRLRNLVVGYTLPTAWTRKVNIKKCRFYFEGTNLFSFDNMKDIGVDPEVSGVQGADYPQHRVYTVGLNLTF